MEEIIAAVLGMAAVALIVYIAYLTLEALVDWYRQYEATLRSDDNKAAVSVAVADAFASDKVTIYQGIWDKRVSSMDELRKVKTDRIDPKLKKAHEESPVIVWQ